MAKASNGVEKLWKVSAGWVGRMSITDRQTERRQTDGRQHIANVREFTFAKKHTDLPLAHCNSSSFSNRLTNTTQNSASCKRLIHAILRMVSISHWTLMVIASSSLLVPHYWNVSITSYHSAQLAFLPVETWTSTTCGFSSWSYSVVGVSYHRERTGGFISRALELHNSLLDSAGFFPAMTGRSCSVHNWWLSS